MRVELLDSTLRQITVVETGESVTIRMLVRFNMEVTDPVFGFLLRNRHGIHLYGTNTELQQIRLGNVRRNEIVEISFPSLAG